MRANKQLISALRRAAVRIENDLDFDWNRVSKCSCGILAQEILRISELELTENFFADLDGQYIFTRELWSKAAEYYYSQSSLPKLFEFLEAAGLEEEDYQTIEFLGEGKDRYDMLAQPKEDHLIIANNMRSLASQLEEQFLAIA